MKCLDEGALQAYLDNELDEVRIRGAAGHLEACAACRDRLGRLEATAGRVKAWLDALLPEDLPVVYEGVPRIAHKMHGPRWGWIAGGLAAALAASATLFVAPPPAPRKEAYLAKPLARRAEPRGTPGWPAGGRPRITMVRPARVRPRPALDGFVVFDDADPMQIGMVVRVMLPVSDDSAIAADLVIGEDGRARAFRFVE